MTTLPALPQRVPGQTMASMADDCDGDTTVCHVCHREHPGGAGGAFCESAGDIFTPTFLDDDGPRRCFECDRHPAVFAIATIQPTLSGGSVGHTFHICKHCVGSVALALPADVDVTITRLMPMRAMPAGLLARLLNALHRSVGKTESGS